MTELAIIAIWCSPALLFWVLRHNLPPWSFVLQAGGVYLLAMWASTCALSARDDKPLFSYTSGCPEAVCPECPECPEDTTGEITWGTRPGRQWTFNAGNRQWTFAADPYPKDPAFGTCVPADSGIEVVDVAIETPCDLECNGRRITIRCKPECCSDQW